MACDPDWLAFYIAEHGRWLYHALGDPGLLEVVLVDGLVPWDENSFGTNHPDAPMTPRPGHVYLADAERLFDTVCYHPTINGPAVAVDLSAVAASRISADEDAFWLDGGVPALQAAAFGLEDPALAVSDPGRRLTREHLPADADAGPRFATLGEWAQALDLGRDPAVTRASLAEYGAVAVAGTIPPSALEPVLFDAGNRPRPLTASELNAAVNVGV